MDFWAPLETEDPEIAQVIRDEEARTQSHLELIASENYPSLAVLQAMGSILTAKYAEAIDRESARELLAKKLEEGARKAAEDARVKEMAREQKNERVTKKSAEKAAKDDDGLVMDVVKSPAFKDFMRTAAREIARGMFKSGRR